MTDWDSPPTNYHWFYESDYQNWENNVWVLMDSKMHMCGFTRDRPNWGMTS